MRSLVWPLIAEIHKHLTLPAGENVSEMIHHLRSVGRGRLAESRRYGLSKLDDARTSTYDCETLKVRLGSHAGDLRWVTRVSLRFHMLHTARDCGKDWDKTSRKILINLTQAEKLKHSGLISVNERRNTWLQRRRAEYSRGTQMFTEMQHASDMLRWSTESPNKAKLLDYQKIVEAYREFGVSYQSMLLEDKLITQDADSMGLDILQERLGAAEII